MGSRIIRAFLVLVALGVAAGAGYFVRAIETENGAARMAADVLREQSSSVFATLADLRVAQVAYVAPGQGEEFWMGRVSKLMPVLEQQIGDFKAGLKSGVALADLEPAFAAIENLQKLDERAQEYVKGGDRLLASDLVFSDLLEATSLVATRVKAALNDEVQIRNAAVGSLRTRELTILGASAGAVLLLFLILAFTGTATASAAEHAPGPASIRDAVAFTNAAGADPAALAAAARICTDMARVADAKQLTALLERAAKVLRSSGMIVWVADSGGRELRPAMAFGYPEQVMARMGRIPREAANAAAAAFRAGQLRTVIGDGSANGAVVAPLFTAEGCVGVLSAEMKGGSEKDESSQAIASIFAAQLATLVSTQTSAALSLAAEA
jgi:hypothetical protein